MLNNKNTDQLSLIVMDNIKELGEKVDEHLMKLNTTNKSFIVPISQIRFNNGEGKIVINESIRNKNVYILCDIGNHSISYEMYGKTSYCGPDEHFQDLKRIICALSGHANTINIVMPLLYASRQHRRKGRESLDCAMSLQELERLGVKEIITFDAHDINIQNAIPFTAFDSIYPTKIILEKMIKDNNLNIDAKDELLVIAPDTGAFDRAKYYADILGTDVGMCYKRRDLSKVVNGKNPIIAHEYLGKDVKGKDILIVDDMIASGLSILECAEEMKNRGAKSVILSVTFAMFTEGYDKFEEAYQKGFIKAVYTTNLTYADDITTKYLWYKRVDCSKLLCEIIGLLSQGKSISHIIKSKTIKL